MPAGGELVRGENLAELREHLASSPLPAGMAQLEAGDGDALVCYPLLIETDAPYLHPMPEGQRFWGFSLSYEDIETDSHPTLTAWYDRLISEGGACLHLALPADVDMAASTQLSRALFELGRRSFENRIPVGLALSLPWQWLSTVATLAAVAENLRVIFEPAGAVVVPQACWQDAQWRALLTALSVQYKTRLWLEPADGSLAGWASVFSPEPYSGKAEVISLTSPQSGLGFAGLWAGEDLDSQPDDDESAKALKSEAIRSRVMSRVALLEALDEAELLPEGIKRDPATVRELDEPFIEAAHRLVSQAAVPLALLRVADLRLPQLDEGNGEAHTTRRMDAQRLIGLFVNERGRWTPHEQRTALTLPSATYRLQCHQDFRLGDAASQTDYLNALGISHVYTSPLLKARSGSPHGYDIIEHASLNPELGTSEVLEHLSHRLREQEMGLIVDIVPNHMGIGKDNPWWMDVLENGPASAHARYFDIDWRPVKGELQGKVLIPVLGGPYGEVLASGQLTLSFDSQRGRLWLNYYDHLLPVNPASYPLVLGNRLELLRLERGEDDMALMRYESIVQAFEHLPAGMGLNSELINLRQREAHVAHTRLMELCRDEASIAAFIQRTIDEAFTVATGDEAPTAASEPIARLHQLLEAQNYRLAYWRVAADEINYRRFFDINDLAGVRVEDSQVFTDTHRRIFDWLDRGLIDGLRIDHPDGLFNPIGYCDQLQHRARTVLHASPADEASSDSLPLYVVVEKILAPFERLSAQWAVHGTTGYDYLNALNGLFVRPEAAESFSRIYERFIGQHSDYHEAVLACKQLIITTALTSELTVLTHLLNDLSESSLVYRDFTLNALRHALIEVIACFPVYRTYVRPGEVSKTDRQYVDWAVRLAKRRSTTMETSIYDFIAKVLLLEFDERDDEAFRNAAAHFAMKFQQVTGPVMAKGVEDTLFYRYNRLISLNEVGGEPNRFGLSMASFHHQNVDRAERHPFGMITTSTHDTKRSEDVRARINVLSEIPHTWQKKLFRWARLNRYRKREIDDTQPPAPSRNDEYLIYQTLIGAAPIEGITPENAASFADRMETYLLKAMREAKQHSSWINQNAAYEEAATSFVRRLLEPATASNRNLFLDDFNAFVEELLPYGLHNALAQALLKLASPGVPDIYQGQERWDFSLVDPDNRRPVDYGELRQMLASLKNEQPTFEQLAVEGWQDGRIKLEVTRRMLAARREAPEVWVNGGYIPLEAVNLSDPEAPHPMREHLVAFARLSADGQRAALVAAPRFVLEAERYLDIRTDGKSSPWQGLGLQWPDALKAFKQWQPLFAHDRATTPQVVLDDNGYLQVESLMPWDDCRFRLAVLQAQGTKTRGPSYDIANC